eukprot:scaffold69032_cov69-Phaeocystis_antarctica.AAC.4
MEMMSPRSNRRGTRGRKRTRDYICTRARVCAAQPVFEPWRGTEVLRLILAVQEARGAHQLRRAALPQRLAAGQQHSHEDTRQENRVDDRENPRNVYDMCVLGRRGGLAPVEGVARGAKVTTEEACNRGGERAWVVRVGVGNE